MNNEKLKLLMSPFDDYCVGYPMRGNYFLAVKSAIGTVENFCYEEEWNLDKIRAFDKAEVVEANMGKINAMRVSSFCGPHGMLWGYDVAARSNLRAQAWPAIKQGANSVSVYDARPLIEAANDLFGTVAKPKFPFLPGAHVPAAYKSDYATGPARLVSAFAIGMTAGGMEMKFLLEHAAVIAKNEDVSVQKQRVITSLAYSLSDIGTTQGVIFKEIFAYATIEDVPAGHTGCALILMPYFLLAKKAQRLIS